MSEATHTQGPWKSEVWEYPHATPPRKELNIQNDKILIATLQCDHLENNPYIVPKAEAEANARLIAAAPELLEALIKLIPHVLHYESMPHAHSEASKDAANARAVLHKAAPELIGF